MRFNKLELATLAQQPSNKFEKEGILFITEKQDGFFRRTEDDIGPTPTKKSSQKRRNTFGCIGGTAKVSLERWCRLRGNLLFYFKNSDQFSEPQGVIVLENCKSVVQNINREQDGYVFYIEFQDGLKQRLAANSNTERSDWQQAIQMASYGELRKRLQMLREKIEKRRGNAQDVDVDMVRLQVGKEIDITEVPICESAISCDNLLCDGHGRPPNPSVVVQVTAQNQSGWIKYSRTEVIERCSNPQFLCTISFRGCDGLHTGSIIRFTVYDVREKLSQTAVPLGSAEISLGVIQDTTRLRIPLRSVGSSGGGGGTTGSGNSGGNGGGGGGGGGGSNAVGGFITIATWAPEQDRKTPRSPAKVVEQQNLGHRRSQSLPPKLGVKLFVPTQAKLSLAFANPSVHTYRLHSGLGGDISVHELMMESQLCFIIPQQLLSIWILREKELLQEISGMGELGGEWRNKQMDLLDKHLKLLKDYSQAKQNLQHISTATHKYFKTSASKSDETCEFAPVNLHLQRMWAHNDTLKRSGILDVITVGAFTRHSGKSKTGGLIKLLQLMKDSPSKMDQNGVKVQAANDVVQAIKQLRREIVEIMSQLLCLAKLKNPKGMLPLCNEMVTKTRVLLNIWEPSLVEEAFEFIEKHRTIEEPENHSMPMSPFRKITQQLGALDLKSPDLEDFATPMGPAPDLWPQIKSNKTNFLTFPNSSINISGGQSVDHIKHMSSLQSHQPHQLNNQFLKTKSPSATDINTISSIQTTVQNYNKSYRSSAGEILQRPPIKSPSKINKSIGIGDNIPPASLPINFEIRNTAGVGVASDPDVDDNVLRFSETHFDINGDVMSSSVEQQESVSIETEHTPQMMKKILNHQNKDEPASFSAAIGGQNEDEDHQQEQQEQQSEEATVNSQRQQFLESKNEILHNSNEFDENGAFVSHNCSIVLGHNGAFLDTKMMSSSPSANYYRPTEEPEPLDLTQLNIEASVMCLVSKVKFLCGRCGSPAVRLRQPKQAITRGFSNLPPDVVTSQPIINQSESSSVNENNTNTINVSNDLTNELNKSISTTTTANTGSTSTSITSTATTTTTNSKDLNLALTQAVGEVARKVKKGNKFTDGLDLSMTTDWASELRPSMRKLRQAMDGLLKTARLMHSVQRLQQDMKRTTATLQTMYRRDVCFSQALTALITALMAKLWGTVISTNYIQVLCGLGPLAYFEGLLSLYGNETDMWGDMCVAIEDLSSIRFTLTRSNIQRDTKSLPMPRVVGSRQSMTVLLPVPEIIYCALPTKETTTFKVTPVFFNIGINEKATLSETLGYTREQHRSNWDNFDRLKQYHIRYKKLNLSVPDTPSKTELTIAAQTVSELLYTMEESLRTNAVKNVNILHLAEDICRSVQGLRLTSCKSAKDRTAMAVTLEQCRILQKEFHLPGNNLQTVLDTMRSEGTRCDNTLKNIGLRKYAFNLPQVMSLPIIYRPPTGSYGKAQT